MFSWRGFNTSRRTALFDLDDFGGFWIIFFLSSCIFISQSASQKARPAIGTFSTKFWNMGRVEEKFRALFNPT